VTAGLALAAVGASSALAAPTWLAPQALAPAQAGSAARASYGPPSVAMNASGDAIAVWAHDGGADGFDLEASTRGPGGAWSAPQSIGTTIAYDGSFAVEPPPSVAIDAQGNAVVVFAHPLTAGHNVVQAVLRQAGGGFGAPLSISDTGVDANAPVVAMNAGGEAVAAWSVGATIQTAIRMPLGSFGQLQSLPVRAGTTSAGSPAVAIAANGAVAAVWLANAGAGNFVEGATRGASDEAFTKTTDALSVANVAGTPAVAVDPNGDATAVWTGPETPGQMVEAKSAPSGGQFGGGQTAISATPARDVSVAVDGSNTATAIWQDVGGALFSSTRPADGAFQAPRQISGGGAINAPTRIAADAGGNLAALWILGGPAQVLSGARQPAGGEFGSAAPISSAASGAAATAPQLAVIDSGDGVAAWLELADGGVAPQVAGFDVSPPTQSAVAIPASGSALASVPFSLISRDIWSPVTTTWSFGDGNSAVGDGATHIYANPGTYTVDVTSVDAVGNATSSSGTIAIGPPQQGGGPGPQPTPTPGAKKPTSKPKAKTVSSTISYAFRVTGSRVTILQMLVRKPPKKATAALRCSGKHCPLKSKKTKKVKKHTIDLLKALGKKKVFRAGQTLDVTVSAPGYNAKVLRFKLKPGKVPTGLHYCIPLGKKKVKKTC